VGGVVFHQRGKAGTKGVKEVGVGEGCVKLW